MAKSYDRRIKERWRKKKQEETIQTMKKIDEFYKEDRFLKKFKNLFPGFIEKLEERVKIK